MKSFKFWINTERGRNVFIATVSVLITLLILLMIFIPLLFSVSSGNNSSSATIGYNRDSVSGTRDAFEDAIDFDEENQTFSQNVLTVSGNSDMINKVMSNNNSIGYASLITVLEQQDGIYDVKDGLNILDFNGVDPLVSSGLNESTPPANPLDDYKAKRYFNVFFRVDGKYNDLIFDNLYINKDMNNLWAESGSFIDSENQYDQFKQEYNVESVNDEQVLLYSFAYFNWLLFSESAKEEMLIIYDQGADRPSFDESYDNFLQNVLLNSPDLITNDSNPIQVVTVGSTSVSPTVTATSIVFVEETVAKVQELGYTPKIEFQSDAVGSGDAFNPDPPSVTSHAWIAMQSRASKDSEEIKFNQSLEENTSGSFDINTNKVYASFEIDALAFVVSDDVVINVVEDDLTKQIKPTNIEDLGVNLIYTQGLNFDQLYGLGLIDGDVSE